MTSDGRLPFRVASAQIVLPCQNVEETVDFFTEQLGFLLESISPADDPAVAVLGGHGVRLRLDRAVTGPTGKLRLLVEGEQLAGSTLTAPNGTVIELAEAHPELLLPPLDQQFTITRGGTGSWVSGRAGMRYRDLIPGREGGRFIVSHIHIPNGGPVPDYVHYHRIRFQVIFVKSGWVKVVYEDQGQPFVMHAGDCVLQPPLIRHRVLESSDDLEVIEIGSPAEHETLPDHQMSLPTGILDPERDFSGQRFVRHHAGDAVWSEWIHPGFDARDTGIHAATAGSGTVRVVRPNGDTPSGAMIHHGGELCFFMVLRGHVLLETEDPIGSYELAEDDAVTIPAQVSHRLVEPTEDLELFEVRIF